MIWYAMFVPQSFKLPFNQIFIVFIKIHANSLSSLVAQANFSSSNLNIFVRQPDGSYTGDALDSPKGDQDQKPYGFWSN